MIDLKKHSLLSPETEYRLARAEIHESVRSTSTVGGIAALVGCAMISREQESQAEQRVGTAAFFLGLGLVVYAYARGTNRLRAIAREYEARRSDTQHSSYDRRA